MTMNSNLIFQLLVGISVAAAAAYLGTFMVLKRMSLVGDALSHVALPGMALAIMFHVSPLLGAFLALLLAVFGIWYIGERSRVYPEALVGVAFTGALALGMIITPAPELLEALFGDITKITLIEGWIAVSLSILVIIVTKVISKKMTLAVVSEDLAKVSGVKTRLINLIYLLSIGVVVALGVKFVGTLLTGALVIVPAAAAKNISSKMIVYSLAAMLIGIFSAGIGITTATMLKFSIGPVVVITTIGFFVISYFLRIKPVKEELS